VAEAARVSAAQAETVLRLEEAFRPESKSITSCACSKRSKSAHSVLVDMESTGVLVDRALLGEIARGFNKELTVSSSTFTAPRGEFNINSTPQLRTVLFEKLKLPVQKRTKTGASTDVEVLEQLAAMGHEVPRLLIEYRELSKLTSTYVDALPGYVSADTGRVHTSFNQTGAATGRLSSSDPNLQTFPSARVAVARFGGRSSRRRGTCCSSPITRRSSSDCWRTFPMTRRLWRHFSAAATSIARPLP